MEMDDHASISAGTLARLAYVCSQAETSCTAESEGDEVVV